jgi:hypothetical protein
MHKDFRRKVLENRILQQVQDAWLEQSYKIKE